MMISVEGLGVGIKLSARFGFYLYCLTCSLHIYSNEIFGLMLLYSMDDSVTRFDTIHFLTN